jgi:flagellar biosynthesis/type III secretory pathway M-ring protein FliF/YscJ
MTKNKTEEKPEVHNSTYFYVILVVIFISLMIVVIIITVIVMSIIYKPSQEKPKKKKKKPKLEVETLDDIELEMKKLDEEIAEEKLNKAKEELRNIVFDDEPDDVEYSSVSEDIIVEI